MELIAVGQYGFVDFSDTTTLTFDPLPTGVSFTSASGEFLVEAQSAPEPMSLTLFGTALLGVLGFRRLRCDRI
jgi:hypothetical protein